MAAIQFAVGERVKARTSLFVPAGTLGTILEIRHAVPGLYFVQFDGHDQLQLIFAQDLERVDEMPPAAHQSTPDAD
jgi:hypothetical protein